MFDNKDIIAELTIFGDSPEEIKNAKIKEYKTLFGNVMSNDNQEKVLDTFLRHYFEEIIRSRPKIEEPTPADLIDILEEIDKAETR